MELRLQGRLSYIDKFNKLKFSYIDEMTLEKLQQHCLGTAFPYTVDDFTVSGLKYIPNDIKQLIGYDCMIRVKLHKYDFVSKLEANLGDQVTGFQLYLIDCKRL
jgi:hypothetical protein